MVWPKREVTKIVYGILLWLLFLNATSANQNRKRQVSDPVSNFFSELGDLFLDADKTIAVQTAPKVEYEDRIVSQIFRPTSEYFNRIQKNYKNIQNRLGKLIEDTLGPKTTYSDRELSTVSPPQPEVEEKAATSAPDSSETKGKEHSTEEASSLARSNIQDDECSPSKTLSDPLLELIRKEKCVRKNLIGSEEQIREAMEKLLLDTRRASQLLLPLDSFNNRISNQFLKRQGDIGSEEADPQGRIIGDVMFSESFYDNRLRQILKDHGRWILDNPLLNRWRAPSQTSTKDSTTEHTTETTELPIAETTPVPTVQSETTEIYVPITSEHQILSKSGKFLQESPPHSSKYYRVVNEDGDVIEEEVDIVLEPQSEYFEDIEADDTEEGEIELRDTVILAFTPDGVPLKLRMGPEIDNPIRYLHNALKSAGVSLNVPIESYEDLEPVGKEVLKLGSGILMRAVYIDVSNDNELKSLLKALRSKPSGKAKF